MTEQYRIKTEVFEGPLDVLLTLIERRKLLINDVALAEVANDYLRYLEQHPEFPVGETAQFVLIGSTLLLIKSKSLLPVLSLTQEEQTSIADLAMRLRSLELFKRRGSELAQMWNSARLYDRERRRVPEVHFSPLAGFDAATAFESITRVQRELPARTPKLSQATVRKVISLEEMIDRLTERINDNVRMSFRQFAGGNETKVNVIVSFLAMLELVRQGVIRVEQEAHYSDIRMESNRVGLPRYG